MMNEYMNFLERDILIDMLHEQFAQIDKHANARDFNIAIVKILLNNAIETIDDDVAKTLICTAYDYCDNM